MKTSQATDSTRGPRSLVWFDGRATKTVSLCLALLGNGGGSSGSLIDFRRRNLRSKCHATQAVQCRALPAINLIQKSLEDREHPSVLCGRSRVFVSYLIIGAAVVHWNHAYFGVRGVSKRTGSNPVHGLSVGWGLPHSGQGFPSG
ncbi:hypothetical protein E2C01_000349 [Portunus trituberculatus]|uniref:Uncharacterized protein n=1 Tax=Portunus trituberculatus TaxID=210409 RepID=A0A5B7CDV0_PORTR|nr:hypothetical protein [Portunus trituberculatus]